MNQDARVDLAVDGRMKAGTVLKGGQISNAQTIHNIKADIKLHGPVVAKYQVFGDFYAGKKTFKWENTNGIYLNGHQFSFTGEKYKIRRSW